MWKLDGLAWMPSIHFLHCVLKKNLKTKQKLKKKVKREGWKKEVKKISTALLPSTDAVHGEAQEL